MKVAAIQRVSDIDAQAKLRRACVLLQAGARTGAALEVGLPVSCRSHMLTLQHRAR